MIFERTGSDFVAEVAIIDFIETAIKAENADANTHTLTTIADFGSAVEGTVTLNIPTEVYEFVAYNSGRQRHINPGVFSEFQALGKSDSHLSANLPIGTSRGQFDISDEDVALALAGIEVQNTVTFTGAFYTNEPYFIRIECGIQEADIYLVDSSTTVDPIDGDRVFIDSTTFVLGKKASDEDSPAVPVAQLPKRVVHTAVAVVEKDIDLTNFNVSLQVSTDLLGNAIRSGDSYADLRDIYLESLLPFKKFGFVDYAEGISEYLPLSVYGVVNSANAFAIVDMLDADIRDHRGHATIRGTVHVKWVVGTITWPNGIQFKEGINTFDGILSSQGDLDNDSEFTEFGPISGAYIGNTNQFASECMHSWEGRSDIGIKKTQESAIGL